MLYRTVAKSSNKKSQQYVYSNSTTQSSGSSYHHSPRPNRSKMPRLEEDHDEKKAKNQNTMRRRKSFYRRFYLLIVTLGGMAFLVCLFYTICRYIDSRVPSVSYDNPDASQLRASGGYNGTEASIIQPEVCFVTASYSKKKKEMDNLLVINNKSPYLRFFLFTNLKDEEWPTPGWKKIVTHFKYRRIITHSRYGKFMGWKEPQIRKCKAVFYMDACLRPSENQTLWRELAETIASDESGIGLMQWPHPKNRSGVLGEFLAIKESKKDITANIVKSLQWMIAQDDLDLNATIYMNENFGYDPNSIAYQKVSQAFWDRYSLEEDSWRDQPLWSFFLHRYNITPTPYPVKYSMMWQRNNGRSLGHHGHTYTSEKDARA